MKLYTRVAPKNRSEGSNLIPRDHFETCREHVLYVFLFFTVVSKTRKFFPFVSNLQTIGTIKWGEQHYLT